MTKQTAASKPLTTPHPTHRPRLLALILVIVTFVAYQSAWHAGFVWDDNDHLTANPAMTAPHGLRMIWSSLAVSRYYPLTLTSFWIQRRLWGLNPMPYHLVNIALHAVNGVLIFFLLRRLRLSAPWLAAMFWVLHPVNVESVAWVTELKNTQSGLFFLLAILCFLKSDAHRTQPFYTLALMCALAALLSKPSTVVLPLVLLLYVWWERGRWQRADLFRIVPFFALSMGMSALTVIEQHREILASGSAEWTLGMAQRLILCGKAIWFYAAKLVWPVELTFVYPHWELNTKSFLSWMPLFGLLAIGLLLWANRRQIWARAAIFGLGYFVLALLPTLGFFDVFYFLYSFVADHFQYLASVGLIAVIVSAGVWACERVGRSGRHIGVAVSSVALVTMGTLTWRQGHAYKDIMTLWRDTLTKNPQCWMAEHNLANELVHQGDINDAIGHWQRALQVKPDFVDAHNNLGAVLFQTGRIQDAINHWEQALRIKPNDFNAHLDLGVALLRLRRSQGSIDHFERAAQARPNSAEAHFNLGVALLQEGKVPEAIEHFERTKQIAPDYAEAYVNLGNALATLRKLADAVAQYERALQIVPDHYEAHLNLGLTLARLGRGREAVPHLEQAVRVKPESIPAQDRLAWLLATLPETDGGDAARALALAERICDMTRNRIAMCVDTLAAAYAAVGRFDDAVATAQKAGPLAQAAGQSALAEQIEARLRLYQAGHAYRQSAEAASPDRP